MLILLHSYAHNVEFGARDDAVARALPLRPVWGGFKSWHRYHMWVEFVVGSLLCSEIFFSRHSGFPLSPKTIIFKFQFDQERQTENHSVDENPKCAKTAEKVVHSAVCAKEKTFRLTYSGICYRSNLISG